MTDKTSAGSSKERVQSVDQQARDIEPMLKQAGWTLSLGAIAAVIEALDTMYGPASETPAPRRHSRNCDCHDCHYSKKHPQVKPHHAACGCFECAGSETSVYTCPCGLTVRACRESACGQRRLVAVPTVEKEPCVRCDGTGVVDGGECIECMYRRSEKANEPPCNCRGWKSSNPALPCPRHPPNPQDDPL